ncbi:hypothetical protein [Acinetobacter calcoaceticus]|nr:hypothetical protein [Acinetobacter calcoaceticus]GLG82350.1 hypothetical protein ACSO1_08720 [Acinetobacter calcoaceticus]
MTAHAITLEFVLPNDMQKRHFNQDEIMPQIKDNAWGETIWYLDLEN